MADKGQEQLAIWISRIVSGPLAIMAVVELVEGLTTGTVGNFMNRGGSTPTIAYAERPVAYLSMLVMWLGLLGGFLWLFKASWLDWAPGDDDQ